MPATPEQTVPDSVRFAGCAWPESYRHDGSVTSASGPLDVWFSSAVLDPLWDDFLRGTPGGQFQQSSLWAEYKAGEGWNQHRVVVTGPAGIVGGFQILWKKSRLVRLGYASKGPVAQPDVPEINRYLAVLLARAAKELRLVALIAQQPDEARDGSGAFEEVGFVRSNPMGVIEATYLVDVRKGMEEWQRKMSASLRRNVRHGRRKGTVVREGTAAELARFFSLMAATCARQQTAPNPPNLDAVVRLWRLFAPSNSIRLTFAECEGAIVAAKLSLYFGQTVSVWKKGWDGSHSDWHPNELLEEDAFTWAHANGCQSCDFCSFDRFAATQLLAGRPVPGRSLSSRDEYHLRFGGSPKLLPRALVFVSNPILRWCFRNTIVRFERHRNRS